MEAAGCDIDRLPEELLAAVISLTSPADARRVAAVSRTFRATADSDAVWSHLLPRDLPEFDQGELACTPPSKKAFFHRLSDEPTLLPCRRVSMRLDRATGGKCYTLSARALHISGGKTEAWEWIKLGYEEIQRNKRFSEAAKLRGGVYLEIHGKINTMMLTENLTYAAYMVFKLAADRFNALDYLFLEAILSDGWRDSRRKVCLQGYVEVGYDGVPHKHILPPSAHFPRVPFTDDIMLPWKRADGWMEVELGEFYKEGYDDEVYARLMETTEYKEGLVVWAIEIRIKQ